MTWYSLFGYRVRSEINLDLPCPEATETWPWDSWHWDFRRLAVGASAPGPLSLSSLRYRSPESTAEIHLVDDFWCLSYPQQADFWLHPHGTVLCQLHQELSEGTLSEWLTGPVAALLMERNGRVCLHGSAVAIGSQIVALLGPSGRGKSTLAAAFVERGYPLFTDDLLPVLVEAGQCYVAPGPRRLRLSNHVLADFPGWQNFFAGETANERGEDGHSLGSTSAYGKRSVRLPESAGQSCSTAGMLRQVWILDSDAEVSSAVKKSLPPSEQLVELVRHSFCARAAAPLGLQRQRLAVLSTLSGACQVGRLTYPRTFRGLQAVVDLLSAAPTT